MNNESEKASDLQALASSMKIDLQVLSPTQKNDLQALTVLMKPESMDHIRASVQQKIPELDCFIVEVMRLVNSYHALLNFASEQGNPIEERTALNKLSESAASLAENISSLSYLTFAILRNAWSVTSLREDPRKAISSVDMKKQLTDDLMQISDLARAMVNSLRDHSKGDLLTFDDNPALRKHLFFRDEMIRNIAKAYSTQSGHPATLWEDEDGLKSTFLTIIEIVLSDIGHSLGRRRLTDIIKQ